MHRCAECGKGGSGLKTCTACKSVKYCNVSCQKAHRSDHKRECQKRATQIRDDALFKHHPKEECPICFLPILISVTTTYQLCCGKTICNGCLYSQGMALNGNKLPLSMHKPPCCAFCRSPMPEDEDSIHKLTARVQAKDARATNLLGCQYFDGTNGAPQNRRKAVELWLQAVQLGSNEGAESLASAYQNGHGVEKDINQAMHYYELAVMRGNVRARRQLGCLEMSKKFNMERAMRHWVIAAEAGDDLSLKRLRKGFQDGYITKDVYAKALRAHKDSNDETKSEMRDLVALGKAMNGTAFHRMSVREREAWEREKRGILDNY
ncbi:hypothetical protein ACHAWF_017939 [Thalassiosira exigua]